MRSPGGQPILPALTVTTNPTTLEDLAPAARAFAQGDVALLGAALSPSELTALVGYLVGTMDAERLGRLAGSPERGVAKEARRGLHRLRTRGHDVGVPAPGRRAVTRAPAASDEEELRSLVTVIDGRGDRVVWLAMPRGGRVVVYQAAISETRGLAAFQHEEITRKEWRGHVMRMMSYPHVAVAETSAAEARRILDEAYDLAVAAGRAVPREFAQVRLELPRLPAPTRHPVLDVVAPADLEGAELERGVEALIDRVELSTWIPEQDALQKMDAALREVVSSPILVDPSARRERAVEAVLGIIDDTIDPAARARLGRRLYETALVFHARGDEAGAALCRSAGDLAHDSSRPASAHPLVRRMYLRLVPPAEALVAEAAEGPLLARP